MGFKGVMMPGDPAVEDYDSPLYDKVFATAVELGLPLSFHILTTKSGSLAQNPRGPRINSFLSIIRGCQDIIGTLIFGGVFDRHPDLKVVCVEADAGWAPHYMYRMDHAYKRHRYWMKAPPLQRMPSDYFSQNIYMTFQDDWVAFKTTDLVNPRRLMWASDFPHSDSTWPHSQAMLERADRQPHRRRAQLDLPRQRRRALRPDGELRGAFRAPIAWRRPLMPHPLRTALMVNRRLGSAASRSCQHGRGRMQNIPDSPARHGGPRKADGRRRGGRRGRFRGGRRRDAARRRGALLAGERPARGAPWRRSRSARCGAHAQGRLAVRELGVDTAALPVRPSYASMIADALYARK